MKIVLITEAQSKTLLHLLRGNQFEYSFIEKKNQLEISKDQAAIGFRLPISINSPDTFFNYPEDRANYILILIRSGTASVGYFENGENVNHKVFRAYMVRKKQGTSQIKYLKTKGKSRAGSRVRLAETLEFFEEINQKLNSYFMEYHVDRIGFSCPVTLIPYFFGSKVTTPFEKDDIRIMKVPKHVQNPNYESLMETNEFLLKGELKYSDEGKDLFEYFMDAIMGITNKFEEDEDW
ncbi:MAG: hypothetical protein WD426_11975 [Anditalea sp.]